MRKPRILLDVDGVLGDFLTPSFAIISQLIGRPFTKADMTDWDIFANIDRAHEPAFYDECNKPGFCRSIPVYPEAKSGVGQLKTIGDVYIVTSPMHHNETWVHEREQWLEANFGFHHKQIVHTSAKYLCKGDVLIDDKPDNLILWAAEHPDGLALLWNQSYNNKETAAGLTRVHGWPEVLGRILLWKERSFLLEPGIYRHFKGGKYRVHRVLRNATNGSSYGPMVYYESVDKSTVHAFEDEFDYMIEPGHYVRGYDEFVSKVRWPDGSIQPRWRKED